MDEGPRRKRSAADRGLFQRPKDSGIWWIRYHDENGREHREKVGPKGLARKAYRRRKTEIQERRFFPERIGRREILLSAVIDDHLARVKGKLRSYDDQERYGRVWKDVLGNRPIRQIAPGDVERWAAEKRQSSAPATVNRYLEFLKRVFNVAIADGKADVNPVCTVTMFKENNERVRYLTDDEEQRLRAEIDDAWWPLVEIAMHTGLRQDEQLSLTWENIDFNAGIITVQRSKHGEARRIPMNDTVRSALRRLPSRFKGGYVFPSKTGVTPLNARNLCNRIFDPAVRRAGITDFHWHDMRHTFGSRLAMAGVDLLAIKDLMGHKTIEMTLRYAHLSPAHHRDAVQRLNRDVTRTITGTREATATDDAASDPQVPEAENESWRGRQDSNLRPTGSKPGALSS